MRDVVIIAPFPKKGRDVSLGRDITVGERMHGEWEACPAIRFYKGILMYRRSSHFFLLRISQDTRDDVAAGWGKGLKGIYEENDLGEVRPSFYEVEEAVENAPKIA